MIQRPKGTFDIIGQEAARWRRMEDQIHQVAHLFHAEEIRTPIFEHTELFVRGVGDTSDIVTKEMYTFTDQGERSLTLRPELTASVMRAYEENGLFNLHKPQKLYYMGPMFRAEAPQLGRQRQFTQMGVEYIGVDSPEADGEVIALVYEILQAVGIEDASIRINSIGSPETRKEFNDYIRQHVKETNGFCKFCKERAESNPLRVIDCKNEHCQKLLEGTRGIQSFLSAADAAHFKALEGYLTRLNIPYIIDEKIVRGLDYYVKTVFEIQVDTIGAQSALGGGGRYDGLLESIGGNREAAGVGFALGMERFVLALKAQNSWEIPEETDSIFIAFMGDKAKILAETMVYELRKQGIVSEMDLLSRNLRGQMKYGDRINAKYAMVLGDDEVISQEAIIKNMRSGKESTISIGNMIQVSELIRKGV